MSLRLVISERAHDDIERNACWWAEHHSIDEAFQWQHYVYQQLAEIVVMPESYALCPEDSLFHVELREKNVGPGRGGYRAIFTIGEEEIYVLTIRSGSQRSLRNRDLDI